MDITEKYQAHLENVITQLQSEKEHLQKQHSEELKVRNEILSSYKAENTRLREALQNATQVIESLISGNRVVNLDEALAFYKSVSALTPQP